MSEWLTLLTAGAGALSTVGKEVGKTFCRPGWPEIGGVSVIALCSWWLGLFCGLGWGFVGGYYIFGQNGLKVSQQYSGDIKRAVRYVAQESTSEIQRAARIKLAGYTTGDDIPRGRRR